MKRRLAVSLMLPMAIVVVRPAPALAAPQLHSSIVEVEDWIEGNGNMALDAGETASLLMSVSNDGDQDATNVTLSIASPSPGVTILSNDARNLGAVPAGQQSVGENFEVVIDENAGCGIEVSFSVHIASDEFSGDETHLAAVTCQPILQLGAVTLKDSSGDVIQAAKPGQEIALEIAIKNTGVNDANHVMGELEGPDVSDPVGTYGTITGDGEGIGTFGLKTPTSCSSSWLYELTVTSDEVPVHSFNIEIAGACSLSLVAMTWDDRSGGNGDGLPTPGETGLISVKLRNAGSESLTSVEATVSFENATATETQVSFGDIGSGEEAIGTPPLSVRVNDDAFTFESNGGGEGCNAYNPINGVDFDSHISSGFVNGRFTVLGVRLEVASSMGIVVLSQGATLVCGIAVSGPPNDRVLSPTGALKLQWIEFAFAMIGFGFVLRVRARPRPRHLARR